MSPRRCLIAGGLAVATAAAFAPPVVQLLVAGGAIALLGLPHGASDLALVAPRRHPSFLAAYLVTAGLVVALWEGAPALGLASLLALSALHFALDAPPRDDPMAAWGWGLLLVGGPAVFHRADLLALFSPLVGPGPAAAWSAGALHVAGLAGPGLVGASHLYRRHAIGTTRLAGLAGLLLLPPLLGFATGFVLVHAWPQLEERRRELGCPSLAAYLKRTAGVTIGAVAVIAGIAITFATHPSAPATILFAAIAALATPHMLVTPLWRLPRAPVGRPCPAHN